MNNFEQRIRTDVVPAQVKGFTASIINAVEEMTNFPGSINVDTHKLVLYHSLVDMLSTLTSLPKTYQVAPAFDLLSQEIEKLKASTPVVRE